MEAWETLYRRKRQERREQREARGAQVRYQQLRQEIADLAIAYCTEDAHGYYWKMHDKVNELRALEQQHPNVKEGM
jgi:hypothetical protein